MCEFWLIYILVAFGVFLHTFSLEDNNYSWIVEIIASLIVAAIWPTALTVAVLDFLSRE